MNKRFYRKDGFHIRITCLFAVFLLTLLMPSSAAAMRYEGDAIEVGSKFTPGEAVTLMIDGTSVSAEKSGSYLLIPLLDPSQPDLDENTQISFTTASGESGIIAVGSREKEESRQESYQGPPQGSDAQWRKFEGNAYFYRTVSFSKLCQTNTSSGTGLEYTAFTFNLKNTDPAFSWSDTTTTVSCLHNASTPIVFDSILEGNYILTEDQNIGWSSSLPNVGVSVSITSDQVTVDDNSGELTITNTRLSQTGTGFCVSLQLFGETAPDPSAVFYVSLFDSNNVLLQTLPVTSSSSAFFEGTTAGLNYSLRETNAAGGPLPASDCMSTFFSGESVSTLGYIYLVSAPNAGSTPQYMLVQLSKMYPALRPAQFTIHKTSSLPGTFPFALADAITGQVLITREITIAEGDTEGSCQFTTLPGDYILREGSTPVPSGYNLKTTVRSEVGQESRTPEAESTSVVLEGIHPGNDIHVYFHNQYTAIPSDNPSADPPSVDPGTPVNPPADPEILTEPSDTPPAETSDVSVPKTSDGTMPWLWIFLLCGSMLVAAAVCIMPLKEEKEKR